MPSITVEIELDLDGYVAPYRPATRWDPEEGGEVADVDIQGVGVVRINRDIPLGQRAGNPRAWITKSILDGVDVKNPDVRKLLDNLLELVREDAEQAIADDYQERAA